jgi:hypothetical protein
VAPSLLAPHSARVRLDGNADVLARLQRDLRLTHCGEDMHVGPLAIDISALALVRRSSGVELERVEPPRPSRPGPRMRSLALTRSSVLGCSAQSRPLVGGTESQICVACSTTAHWSAIHEPHLPRARVLTRGPWDDVAQFVDPSRPRREAHRHAPALTFGISGLS